MKRKELFLDFYFRKILGYIAILSPPQAYRLLPLLGNRFRNFKTYPSAYEEGVLMRGIENLKRTKNYSDAGAKKIIKEYLKYETRFLIENVWIKKRATKKIQNCFCSYDIDLLYRTLRSDTYLIATAHTSGIFLLIALLDALNLTTPFICMNMMNMPWEKATPFQRACQDMWVYWTKFQPLMYVDEGNTIQKSRDILRSNRSLALACDVPQHLRGGVVRLFNLKVRIPFGASRLANESQKPILVAIPWTDKVINPYRIYMTKIFPSGNIKQDMKFIMEDMECAINKNPSCWNGWLYLDRMMVEIQF